MAQPLVRPEPHFEQNPGLEPATAVDGLSQHCPVRLQGGVPGTAWQSVVPRPRRLDQKNDARLPANLSLMITKLRTWSRLVGALAGTQ